MGFAPSLARVTKVVNTETPDRTSTLEGEPAPDGTNRRRWFGFAGFAALLALIFSQALWSLANLALKSDVLSYILLVPFVSGYLIYIRKNELPRRYVSSPGLAAAALALGLGALGAAWLIRGEGGSLVRGEPLTLVTLAFLACLLAGAFVFLGRQWIAAAAYPVAFLALMIPLPDRLIDTLETASKLASAEAAELFFTLSGTPHLRDGNTFQLPNIVLEVAQECSGIRSSLVLIITSLVAANMFLKSAWRRAILVGVVIPLGVLRNGFRIMVIGMLCVYKGPHMIHHAIHSRGGPVFFGLALIPFFLVLWWLRRGEARRERPAEGGGQEAIRSGSET